MLQVQRSVCYSWSEITRPEVLNWGHLATSGATDIQWVEAREARTHLRQCTCQPPTQLASGAKVPKPRIPCYLMTHRF